jgi:hypothetical protein
VIIVSLFDALSQVIERISISSVSLLQSIH